MGTEGCTEQRKGRYNHDSKDRSGCFPSRCASSSVGCCPQLHCQSWVMTISKLQPGKGEEKKRRAGNFLLSRKHGSCTYPLIHIPGQGPSHVATSSCKEGWEVQSLSRQQRAQLAMSCNYQSGQKASLFFIQPNFTFNGFEKQFLCLLHCCQW